MKPQDMYEYVKRIAVGGEGTTNIYKHKRTGEKIVVKFPIKGKESYITHEKKIFRHLMKKLPTTCRRMFPKILDFQGNFDGRKYYLAMEYIQGKTLDSMANNKREYKSIITQIQKGIKCLWKVGVIHGDLHTANIMINNKGKVKIVDFGASQIFDPLTNRNQINVWFNSKHQNMWKMRQKVAGIQPGNPNSAWFGYNKPMYHPENKIRISKMLKHTKLYTKKPYRKFEDLKKIGKLLHFEIDTKTRNQLEKKIYNVTDDFLEEIIREYYGVRGNRKIPGVRFRPNLFKKLINYR